MNSALKRVAERALVISGADRISRLRMRDRLLVLAYHNVVPDDADIAGDRSLHLSHKTFAAQLDILASSHEVVAIDALADRGNHGRPRVVITFDDAYEGAVTLAVDELTKRRMPATVFVAPGLLGTVPWWDVVADPQVGGVPTEFRDQALTALRGDGRLILKSRLHGQSKPAAISLPRIATEVQLAAAVSQPGISVASHTWSHLNLTTLTTRDLHAELARPVEWLRSRFSSTLPFLSYPYGFFNDTVERAAQEEGYIAAFKIDGGWLSPSSVRPTALSRLNIPAGLSADGFRLRLAGL